MISEKDAIDRLNELKYLMTKVNALKLQETTDKINSLMDHLTKTAPGERKMEIITINWAAIKPVAEDFVKAAEEVVGWDGKGMLSSGKLKKLKEHFDAYSKR